MGKSAPRAPAPPDPAATAQAQAEANRLNQLLPGGGGLTYGQFDANGNFIPSNNHAGVRVNESPYQQQLRQRSENLSLQLADLLGGNLSSLPSFQSQINFGALNPLPSSQDFSGDALRVEQSTFDRARNLLTPEFDRQNNRSVQQLANQGLPIGSEAYQEELDRLDRQRNQALEAASQDAVQAGRAEQQRLFANALATRQTGLGEQLQSINLNNSARGNMLQELASLLGGQQFNPASTGGFINTPQIDVAGPINAAYQGQLQNYNNRFSGQQQGLNNFLRLASSIPFFF
ncbi:MAG: hypothetical protein AB7G80_04960 [Dongiaceae bacterium]